MTRPTPPLNEHRTSRDDDRYGGFETEDGYVVYDADEHRAWIQSDTAVDIEEIA